MQGGETSRTLMLKEAEMHSLQKNASDNCRLVPEADRGIAESAPITQGRVSTNVFRPHLQMDHIELSSEIKHSTMSLKCDRNSQRQHYS